MRRITVDRAQELLTDAATYLGKWYADGDQELPSACNARACLEAAIYRLQVAREKLDGQIREHALEREARIGQLLAEQARHMQLVAQSRPTRVLPPHAVPPGDAPTDVVAAYRRSRLGGW